MENTETKNKPIAPTLRQMNVGDVEQFPIRQYASVRNTLYNAMRPETATGQKYAVEVGRHEDNTPYTKVTRLA